MCTLGDIGDGSNPGIPLPIWEPELNSEFYNKDCKFRVHSWTDFYICVNAANHHQTKKKKQAFLSSEAARVAPPAPAPSSAVNCQTDLTYVVIFTGFLQVI